MSSMNIAVIKHEDGVEEVVKIEGQEEIQEEELTRATAILQNLGHLAEGEHIIQHSNADEIQNSDGNLQIVTQQDGGDNATLTYVIQSEYVNENGETTVEYRLIDNLTDGQHYVVEEYGTQYGEDAEGNVYETVFVQQQDRETDAMVVAEEGYVLRREELQPQNEEFEDEGQMTIVEEESDGEQSAIPHKTEFVYLPEPPKQDSVHSTAADKPDDASNPVPFPVSVDTVTVKLEPDVQFVDEPEFIETSNNNDQNATDSTSKETSHIISNDKDPLANRKKEKKGPTYACSECDKVFKSEAGVKIHRTAVHSEKSHRKTETAATGEGGEEGKEKKDGFFNFQLCPCCSEPSDDAHTIGDHECNKCQKLFVYNICLSRHQSLEHPIGEDFVCCECHKIYREKEKLIEHMRIHTIKPVRCDDCGRQFTRKFHLDRHISQTGCMGGLMPVYPCKACKRTFTRKDNLAEHLKSHLGTARPKKNYRCDECSKDFSSSAMLNIHYRSHTGDRPYPCDICAKKFISSGALKKHRRMHTGEKPYTCEKCDKKFAAKETLNRHLKTHTGIKPHSCHICGKAFIQATQLRAHIFHHTGENAYICSHCGRAFNRKLRLTNHIKFIHEGAEPMKCPALDCHKTFFRREDLVRHSVIHSGEKPHKCPDCDKCFATKSSLKTHTLTHRVEQPIACDTCGRAFIRQDCLIRHVRAKHRDVLEDIVSSVEKKRIKNRLVQIAGQYNSKKILNNNQVWNELTLTESIKELLSLLVDPECLKDFGHPVTPVDRVLEAVIKRCGHEPASDERYDYIERMRENAKLLFTVVIDDASVKDLLGNQTVDEVILHVLKLAKRSDEDSKEGILSENPLLQERHQGSNSEAEDDPENIHPHNADPLENPEFVACEEERPLDEMEESSESEEKENLYIAEEEREDTEEDLNEEEASEYYDEERLEEVETNEGDVEEDYQTIEDGILTTTIYVDADSEEIFEDETTQENIIIEMSED